ncbi:MAG: TlyA family RNA methyltransferase [Ruminococcus sp.]|nr:TlyA family RNA methyltransferase [Ruminococcus sp.]
MARLDVELITRGIACSRARAQELIKGGQIKLDGIVCTKPSKQTDEKSEITMEGEGLAYVGRGGLKLERAVRLFDIALDGLICMDIGASTGGFTDFMIQNGAEKVYAVDVGHGQLADKLRQDIRVINLEGTDIRTLDTDIISEPVDFISADVSFISLTFILPHIARFLKKNGTAIVLIKPQFEAGRENIGKNGIVKSRSVHMNVLVRIKEELSKNGLSFVSLCPSPVRGGSGNIEYLAAMCNSDKPDAAVDLKAVIEEAFLMQK